MPEIPAEKLTEDQKKAVADMIAGPRGRIGGPFIPLLRSPETLTRVQQLGAHLRFKSALPPRLSEYLILLVARTWTQGTEWHAHRGLALKGGLKEEIADAIAEGRRPDNMADDEAALWDLYDELQRNRSVSDATYARLTKLFGEQGVIDAVAILGYYTLLAMVLNTTRVPTPAESTNRLKPFPH
jgi:4-carboxymuconolactone decarboxylase